jgi:oxygen-dependent protoporphyrinogen oxidase
VTRRLIIIGGGIAGLSAAYRAHELLGASADTWEVLLLEASPQVGGKLRTTHHEGHALEHGPNAFLDPAPALKDLVERSKLPILTAAHAAKRRFLVRDRKLYELKPDPAHFLRSGLLPLTASLRLAREPFIGRRRSTHNNHPGEGWGDESVHAFFARRFGPKAADLFAAPLASGVFAGDPKQLSLPAAFPQLAAMEEEHGSLIKALSQLKKRKDAGHPMPTLHAPAAGMQALAEALAENAPFTIRTDAPVDALALNGSHWDISVSGLSPLAADALILATPATAAANLLQPHLPAAAATLKRIPYPHLIVLHLLYAPDQANRFPQAFGALHAHDGTSNLLGTLHESHIFPTRSSSGALLLRVLLGGTTRPDLATLPDPDLLHTAITELAQLHNLSAPPIHTNITHHPASIPQYHLGHARLIADLTAQQRAIPTPPLALCGNYLTGVSLSDTAASGHQAADSLIPHMPSQAP